MSETTLFDDDKKQWTSWFRGEAASEEFLTKREQPQEQNREAL